MKTFNALLSAVSAITTVSAALLLEDQYFLESIQDQLNDYIDFNGAVNQLVEYVNNNY